MNEHHKKKPKFFSSFLLSGSDLDVGERKLNFSIYVLHRLWLAVILEVLFYVAARNFSQYAHSELITIMKTINEFFLMGTSIILGVYTTGNVMGRKYGEMGGYGGYDANGNIQQGGINQGGVNVNITKTPQPVVPPGEHQDGEVAVGGATPARLPPLPVKEKRLPAAGPAKPKINIK
jgi:hypothetical protein